MLIVPGPIYRIKLGDSSMIVVSSYAYVAEMSDEERFRKSIEGELDVSGPENIIGQRV